MFNFKELKSIHVELTSKCQASCPMCARNYHGHQENKNLPIDNISLEEFKNIFTSEVLNQIEHIYFCGNFGDPIMSTELISIIEYCKETNHKISLAIHTNGSARTVSWWKELAQALPDNHMVHFALDGLEDTHHLYRIGTDFNKIIENAKSFISAGGKAEWVFLSFKHNEHQIEKAKQLAQEIGFARFFHKATSRFLEKPWLDVLGKNNEVLYKIEAPTEHALVFIKPEMIKGYREITKTAKIHCKVKEERSIYIDAFKNLWPCCWIGALPYIYSRTSDLAHEYQTDQTKVIKQLVDDIGGWDRIDLAKRSIKDVIDDSKWNSIWQSYWNDHKLATCAKVCGTFPEKIIPQYKDQFIEVKDLVG